MRMTAHAARIPNAANATFFAFQEAQLSAAEAFTEKGSCDVRGSSQAFFSACARTASGDAGTLSAVAGDCGTAVSDGGGVAFSEAVAAIVPVALSDAFGATGFSTVAVLASSTSFTGGATLTGFGVSLAGACVATGSGAFRTTVAVDRISPSGEVSVTAPSE